MTSAVHTHLEDALPEAATTRLRRALGQHDASGSRLRSGLGWMSFAVPAAPVEALLALRPDEPAVLYAPPEGVSFAGLGCAAELVADGSPRSLRDAAEALLRDLDEVDVQDGGRPASVRPRLFGGFAFDPDARQAEPWEELGKGRLLLPRWTYQRDGALAWLSLVIPPDADVDELELELGELSAGLARHAALAGESLASSAWARPLPVEVDATAQSWSVRVDAIKRAIASGALHKVVAAQRATLGFERPLDEVGILRRLVDRHPASTRFAIRHAGRVFLGATPERLVERRGLSVYSEALAGTMARERAAELLRSAKDREEHQLVVDTLLEALGPVCRVLHHEAEPRLRSLRDVSHLQTPVTGELREPLHILELVDRLHPTPAVGGAPRSAAIAWIREHEDVGRGWFSGPFGWLDATGDGSFVVAIRCGVLRGSKAWMYAGNGIVRDSEVEAEAAEIELKMRTLGETLGGG